MSHEHDRQKEEDEEGLENRGFLIRWWHKIMMLLITIPGLGVAFYLVYHPIAYYFGLPCP
jgi:hypothetical protein